MVGISTLKITNVFWTFLETSSSLNFENRCKIVEAIEFKRFGVKYFFVSFICQYTQLVTGVFKVPCVSYGDSGCLWPS